MGKLGLDLEVSIPSEVGFGPTCRVVDMMVIMIGAKEPFLR